MSRSIRGYSSANLTIESLSLLGIDVTTIDATTGNIITLNSTTVNATNANITNVSIGTLTIDNATVNQLLTANNITASGTITANGNVVVTSLPQDNTDNNDRYIVFQGLNNILRSDSKLTFNPSTNTLTIIGLSCQDISASGTISGGTISGTFNIVAENKTADTNFPISFHDTSSDRVSIGDASYLSSFTFNPSTRTMVLENGQITNATIALGNIAIANITDANINANSRSDDVEYKVVLLRASDDRICEDSSNNITYNPLNERLTVVKTTTTNLKIGQLLTTSNDTFYPCMFQGNNNDISRSPLLSNFHYNPSQLKLKIDNVEVTDDLTVTDDLSVSGRTDLGNVVSINSLNSVVSNTTYPLLTWDNTSSGSRTIRVDTSNLYYDTTNNTLYAPNISGSFNITASTRSNDQAYPVSFHDTGTNQICIDSASTNITWNPSQNVLDVRNIDVAVDLTVNNDATITGDTTITAVNSTVSNNNRIPFIEGGGATGRLCESNLYYNPNNQTLVSANITTTSAINSPTVTVTGTNNGQLTIDPTYGLFINHADGHVFRMAGIWKLRISSAEIGMYANLRLNPNNSNNETNIIFNEYSASASGDKSKIQFSNIGQIISSRDASLNPVLEFINTGATPEVQYQIQLNSTNNKYNTPDGGSHNFLIDTFSEFEITVSETIIKNTLKLEDVTLPTANTNFFLLLQNSGNGQVKRSNLVFNPVSEILTINKLKLENTDTATATDNKLLFLDPNDEVEKSDSNLSYDATTSTLTFKILDNSSADSKITVQKPLHYGAGVFSQPLNYTIRVGHTDLIQTIDVLGSGLNTGKFGNGIYLSILRSGVKTTAYGQNSLLWNWNAYVDATDTATVFTMGGLPGLWDVMVTFKFQWDSGNTNRANPIIKAEINGSTTQEEGVESQYVRQQLGRIVTVKYHNKLYFNTSDTIAFRTFLNIGSTTNFTSLATSSQFDLSDFMFMATYMGPLDEYDKTPT